MFAAIGAIVMAYFAFKTDPQAAAKAEDERRAQEEQHEKKKKEALAQAAKWGLGTWVGAIIIFLLHVVLLTPLRSPFLELIGFNRAMTKLGVNVSMSWYDSA